MAVTYSSVGTAFASASTASIAYPTTVTADQMLILAAAKKFPATSGNIATPSGWTLLGHQSTSGLTDGVDTGNVTVSIFYRIATGSEGGTTFSFTQPASTNVTYARIFSYSRSAGYGWEVAGTAGTDTTVNTAWSVTGSTNPGITAGDFMVAFSAVNSDGPGFASQAMSATGISAWGTMTERNDVGTTVGSDIKLVVSDHPVTTGTATAAPVYTMTGTTTGTGFPAGATYMVRLREKMPGAAVSTLTDAFSSTLDTSKWTASGTVTVSSGYASLAASATLNTVASYDFASSALYFRFNATGQGAVWQDSAGFNSIVIDNLNRLVFADGNGSATTLTYDSGIHRWLRISGDSTANIGTYAWSTDGSTWNDAGGLSLTNVIPTLDGRRLPFTFGAPSTSQTILIDNVNTAPPTSLDSGGGSNIALTTDSLTSSGTYESLILTVASSVVTAALTSANTLQATTVSSTTFTSLTTNDLTSAGMLANPTLTTDLLLTSANLTSADTLEAATVTQQTLTTLSADPLSSATTADNTVVTSDHAVAPATSTSATTADSPALTTTTSIAADNLASDSQIGMATITKHAVLTASDATSASDASTGTLTLADVLTTADMSSQATLDASTVTTDTALVGDDIVSDSVLQGVAVSSTGFTGLAVADMVSLSQSDTPTISALDDTLLVAADLISVSQIGATAVSGEVILTIDDLLSISTADNPTITATVSEAILTVSALHSNSVLQRVTFEGAGSGSSIRYSGVSFRPSYELRKRLRIRI